MANQQLSDYIRQQLQQGKSKEEIKSQLLAAGWQETNVNEAFNAFNHVQPPSPLPPQPSSLTSTGMRQLDPKAVWLFFISLISRWSVLIIIFGVYPFVLLSRLQEKIDYVSFGFLAWLLVLIPAFLAFFFIWAKLTYRFYRYELTDAGFRKELGVIYKRYVTIPYDRIQNVDIHRGILARILGLSDLNIQTAGASATVSRYGVRGAGAEGRLPALSKETAEQLRDELIKRASQYKNQGL